MKSGWNCVTRSVAFIGIFPSSLPQPTSKDLKTPFNIQHLFLSSLCNNVEKIKRLNVVRGEGNKLDFSIKIQITHLRYESGIFHLRSLWNWDILYWWIKWPITLIFPSFDILKKRINNLFSFQMLYLHGLPRLLHGIKRWLEAITFKLLLCECCRGVQIIE